MEWKEVDICQLCDSVSETYKGNASEVVLINTSDVLDGKCLNHEYVPNKKLKGQFKKTFRKGDILYSEIRPANKRFCFVDFEPKDYIASTKLMVLRAHEDVDPQYLYQILRSNDTLTQLQMLAESRSGTFPQITYSELSNIMVNLPSQKAQENIVSILSSLDRKIELNNKINADLEEMAQAIFKNWFVDFEPFKDGKFVDSELGMIPEGWKVGCLGDIAEITSGKRPPKKSKDKTKDLFIPLIGASDIMGFTSDVLYERPILVIGRVGTHGVVQRFQEKCWPSDNTLVIESSYYNYVYQLLKRIDYSAINRGSTQPLITQTDVKNTDVIIAPENVLKEYESITSTLFSKHRANNKENSRLSLLRDTLLPRLMSGEIEVPE